jgi:N-acetylglucosamine transport system permease protein
MHRRHKWRLIIPFVFPQLCAFVLLTIYPNLRAFYDALTSWGGFTPTRTFIGLRNFEWLIGDRNFWNALRHNFTFALALPFIVLTISLLIAAYLTRQKGRLTSAYRIVIFFPSVIGGVALYFLFAFVLSPNIGLVNNVLRAVGLGALARPWLADATLVIPVLIVLTAWASAGFYIILFMSGIAGIPRELEDAARVDGAGEFAVFRYVTLPLLWDIVKIATVNLVNGSFNIFGMVFIMTQGGPNRASDVYATYLYQQAFEFAKFGYATAMGVFMFFLTFVLILFSWRAMRREAVQF